MLAMTHAVDALFIVFLGAADPPVLFVSHVVEGLCLNLSHTT